MLINAKKNYVIRDRVGIQTQIVKQAVFVVMEPYVIQVLVNVYQLTNVASVVESMKNGQNVAVNVVSQHVVMINLMRNVQRSVKGDVSV